MCVCVCVCVCVCGNITYGVSESTGGIIALRRKLDKKDTADVRKEEGSEGREGKVILILPH